MSSKAKKVSDKIVEQRISTVTQVLAIMEEEAKKMSFWQRRKLARSFLWKKNISCFFHLAEDNKKKERRHGK